MGSLRAPRVYFGARAACSPRRHGDTEVSFPSFLVDGWLRLVAVVVAPTDGEFDEAVEDKADPGIDHEAPVEAVGLVARG